MVRYFLLLAQSAVAAAETSGHDCVDLGDAALALSRCGIFLPHLDFDDCSDIDDFRAWLRGPCPQRASHAAKLQHQALSALGAAQGAAIAAQQANQDISSLVSLHNAFDAVNPAVEDWLKVMIKKQILMGHDKRYRNTVFGDSVEERPVIAGGPPTIDDFFAQKCAGSLSASTPSPQGNRAGNSPA